MPEFSPEMITAIEIAANSMLRIILIAHAENPKDDDKAKLVAHLATLQIPSRLILLAGTADQST